MNQEVLTDVEVVSTHVLDVPFQHLLLLVVVFHRLVGPEMILLSGQSIAA